MPITAAEEKTIVPTLLIGVGGTGLEVIMRVRRLVTESYGSLSNFPVLSFLHIDTEQNAKPSNPLMAGPKLEDFEICHLKVSHQDAERIVNDPNGYDWYHEWLPPELVPKTQLLVSQEGAGQIRACGRFSFFFNYKKIESACTSARTKIKFHEQTMLDKYGLQVLPKLNIFVVGSIAGGTGSGMLIDLGYSLKRWFVGEPGLEATAIISTPDAFGSIDANSRVKENGYAALMELNYFSDDRTTFSVRYGAAEGSRIESSQPPYNYIYLIGTSNEQGVNLKLDDVRETIAQNIFLDLVSDFSAYKRSIRDNIKKQAAGQNDTPPQGRSYPRTFMSFGLATIEIPIHQVRSSIAARLTADLCQWWENQEVSLMPEPRIFVEAELRKMNLIGNELRASILRATDRPYQAVVQQWLSSIRQEILQDNLLECDATGLNFLKKEQGKIRTFVDEYFIPKVNEYKSDHFQDNSSNPMTHGDYLQVMYGNQNNLISFGTTTLQEKVYTYLIDRNCGPKFLQTMLDLMESIFETDIQRFRSEAEKTWSVVEREHFKEYEAALSRINDAKLRGGLTKQDQINKDCDIALEKLGNSWQALLERKSRVIGIAVLERMKVFVTELRRDLNRWQLLVAGTKGKYRAVSEQAANQADTLEMVGVKLFERQKLNELYQDFLSFMVSDKTGGIDLAARRGLDVICQQMTEEVLSRSSKFWVESREDRAIFRLLDIEKIVDAQYPDFEDIVHTITHKKITEAPMQTRLHSDMDACTQLMKMYPEDAQQDQQIRRISERSKPLVRLDPGIPQSSGFDYIQLAKSGLIGGDKTTEPAAQKQVLILRKYFTATDAISPLTNRERYKILAVHEVGGFSLRCLQGTEQMRRSYFDWRGQRVKAERDNLKGWQADLPLSVHIQKDMVFWDFVPADPKIEELVVITRALGILRDEINQNTKNSVIRYSKISDRETENVTLAANWEDTVQVLQLPDCGNDKKELQRQLDELIENADTVQEKQQLESYLTQRLQDFRRQGGEDNPLYLRERDIIRKFIKAHLDCPPPSQNPHPNSGLGFDISPSDSTQPPISSNLASAVPPQLKFCGNCGNQLRPHVRFCEQCGRSVSASD
jgi:hypothetical protein